MELSSSKLIAAITMAFITFLSSMAPLLIVKRIERRGRLENSSILSFLSCFGGGVFLGTCLLHLFPDVSEQMGLILKALEIQSGFPLTEFLLGFGFLFVLTAEQIVLTFKGDGISPGVQVFFSHQHSHGESYQNYGAINKSVAEPYPGSSQSIPADGTQEQGGNVICHPSSEVVVKSKKHGFPGEGSFLNPQPVHGESYQNYGAEAGPFTDNHQEPRDNDIDHHSHEVSVHQDSSSHSVLRSLLLLFALAVHSVFEGLAIGLQSTTEKVFSIMLAVLIHKCIIAFILGLNLMQNSRLSTTNILTGITFFSLTSPVGIVIGLVVVDFITGVPMLIASGVLQGLAAGTFLYVTFFEILPQELKKSESRLIKLGCIILGFSLVSFLVLYLPD